MKYALIFLCSCQLTILIGQADSSYRLPMVEITGKPGSILTSGAAGNISIDSLDAIPGLHSLAELTDLQLPVFNAYGPGRLTTIGVRGAPARQTAVFWEGIPINSPMIGTADLSLMQMDPSMTIELSQGIWAATKGPGSAAGSLGLSEQWYGATPGLSAQGSVTMGSFGIWTGRISLAHQHHNIKGRLTASLRSAENDFTYERFGSEERLQNASNRMPQVKWSGVVEIGDGQSLVAGSWWMQYDREIPPTRLQAFSQASESGHAWRNFIRHQWVMRKVELRSTVSFTTEAFSYADPLLDLDQTNSSWQWFVQQQLSGGRKRWWWKAGWDGAFTQAASPNYPDGAAIQRLGVTFGAGTSFGIWQLEWSGRQDLEGRRWGVPVLNFRFSGDLDHHWSLFGGAGSFFRWPSMDDLLWSPGGDPGLDPEYGWQSEIGGLYHLTDLPGSTASISGTVFFREQFGAIQWYPDGVLWRVRNLGRLRSYGAIIQGKLQWSIPGGALWTNMNVQLTRSDEVTDNDGLQEIYVPLISGLFEIGSRYRQWSLRTQHQYRSRRYYLNASDAFLPGVALHHVHLGFKTMTGKVPLVLGLSIRNILDRQHEWVIDRPMPGRHFLFTIMING